MRPRRAGRRIAALALAAAAAAVGSGCTTSAQLVSQQPTAVTQQLIMRALERAVDAIDADRYRDKSVSLDVYTQIKTEPLVREYVAAALERRGVHVGRKPPELALKVFVSALGTDHGETLIGLPALQLLTVGIPELALFKWSRNRGLAEMSVYAFDGRTGNFVAEELPRIGRSKQDDYTVLLVIGFTVSDADERGY